MYGGPKLPNLKKIYHNYDLNALLCQTNLLFQINLYKLSVKLDLKKYVFL